MIVKFHTQYIILGGLFSYQSRIYNDVMFGDFFGNAQPGASALLL